MRWLSRRPGARGVSAAPAALGGDAEVGNGFRRGRDAALFAVAIIVVDDTEIEIAACGQAMGGERRVVGIVVPRSEPGPAACP